MVNKIHQKYLKIISPYYPKASYPLNPNEWNMGHKCMAYMDKKIPYEKILTPSWIMMFLQKSMLRETLPPDLNIKTLINMYFFANQQLIKIRYANNTPLLSLLKKHGTANCGEWGKIAQEWLQKQGVPCQRIGIKIMSDEESNQASHVFILFHQKKPELCHDFEEAIQHLNDPDMYILDLWCRCCAPAKEMLNTYCRELIDNSDIMKPKEFTDDYKVYLQEDFNSFLERCFQREEKMVLYDDSPLCLIGHVKTKKGQKVFSPQKKPIFLETQKSEEIKQVEQIFETFNSLANRDR